jgi:adenine-specific DNA methylase
VRCEGPGCGAEVPLVRSLWLAKKGPRSKALRLVPNRKTARVDVEVIDVLIEEGVGKQAQFWKLAQSLSALYPSGSDEKRWVDGVLGRKKGLGFG